MIEMTQRTTFSISLMPHVREAVNLSVFAYRRSLCNKKNTEEEVGYTGYWIYLNP